MENVLLGIIIVVWLASWVTPIVERICKKILEEKGQKSTNNLINYKSEKKSMRSAEIPNENMIYMKIKEVDNNFDKYKFLTWFENFFGKYQKALDEMDSSVIEAISTKEFYKKIFLEKKKLSRTEKNIQIKFKKIINMRIYSYEQKNNKEQILMYVKFYKNKDEYNIKTNEIIRGMSGIEIKAEQFILLERFNMINEDYKKIEKTNCPFCGAPTQVFSTGKCPYCGKIIEINSNYWKIADTWGLSEQKRKEWQEEIRQNTV